MKELRDIMLQCNPCVRCPQDESCCGYEMRKCDAHKSWMKLVDHLRLLEKENKQLHDRLDICEKSVLNYGDGKHDELVNRATPKKLDYEGDGYADGELVYDTAICRSCGKVFEVDYDEHANYCPNCGQALDWGDEDA